MYTTSHPAWRPRSRKEDAPSDEAMLKGLGHGDPEAESAFVRRFQRSSYGLARSIVTDATLAEDIAQEALVRAWRRAETYDSRRGSVTTWLLRITRNLSVDALRRRPPEPLDPGAVVFLNQSARGPAPEESATITDDADRVQTALRQLPVEQRRALLLATFYGYTAQHISDAEAIPLGTAKTRIRRGLTNVRGLLHEDRTLQPGPTSCAG